MIRRVMVAIVAAAGLWFGWQRLFPDDEAQIRAVLARISDAVDATDDGEDNTGSGGIEGIARVATLQNEFSSDATIDAGPPFPQLRGRQAIVATAGRVRTAARRLELRFPDVEVAVAHDGQSATALVTAEARFDEPGGGRGIDARELELTFARVDNQWVIASVVLVEALERLPESRE